MTKAKKALCEALVNQWRLNGNMKDVIFEAWRADHGAEKVPYEQWQNVLFGSQFVHPHWPVRGWVSANARHLSDRLFESKDDETCICFAQSINWRRDKQTSHRAQGGLRPTMVNTPILMRSLSKKHDWNTCK